MSTMSRKFLLLSALLTLLLGGVAACSLAGFGYDIAPRLAVRYADDYLQLTNSQEAHALELFEARQTQHRKDELPQYAILMADVESRFHDDPTLDDFNFVFERTNELWNLAVRRTVPAISEILADLDDDQLDALEESLAESAAKYEKRIKDHDPVERRDETIEDIEEWTGDLDDAQRAFVIDRLESLHDTRTGWLRWRIERNARLMAVLKSKPGKERIEAFMVSSWAERNGIDPELQAQTDENRVSYQKFLIDLHDRLTPEQRAGVGEQLAEYREIVFDLLSEEQRLAVEDAIKAQRGQGFPTETVGTQ